MAQNNAPSIASLPALLRQPAWKLPALPRLLTGWRLEALLVAALVGVIGAYKWSALAGYDAPPGADPGNWLRLAHTVAGERHQAAETTYPPVIPAMLRLLLIPFEPLLAVKLLGVIVSVLPAVPVFLILRRHLSAMFATPLAATVVLAGYQQEALAWGGYTQLLGVTFLLFGILALDRWFESRERSQLRLSAACIALAVGTSHFVAVSLIPILGVYWLLAGPLKISIRGDERIAGFKAWLIASFGLCLLVAPWYIYMAFLTAGGATPVREGLFGTYAYEFVFRESLGFWLALLPASLVLAIVNLGDTRLSPLRRLFASLLVGSFVAFAVTGELRYLQITQLGIILSVAYFIAWIVEAAGRFEVRVVDLGWAVPAVVTGAFILAVAVPGDSRLQEAASYYQTVDPAAKEALDYVRTGTEGGSLVLAGTNAKGMPHGWWIEGYAQRPTLIEMNPELLFYTSEREQVEVVRRMLDPGISDVELGKLLSAYDVRYVFVDRESNAAFEAMLLRVEHCVAFDNGAFWIARLNRDGASCGGSS